MERGQEGTGGERERERETFIVGKRERDFHSGEERERDFHGGEERERETFIVGKREREREREGERERQRQRQRERESCLKRVWHKVRDRGRRERGGLAHVKLI